jgi:hypothetical protein
MSSNPVESAESENSGSDSESGEEGLPERTTSKSDEKEENLTY